VREVCIARRGERGVYSNRIVTCDSTHDSTGMATPPDIQLYF